jgi:uncharacterized small protein (DUF1192 family)
MWPFLTLEEKIGRLEDEIAGLRAELHVYSDLISENSFYMAYHNSSILEANKKLATRESKLERLKKRDFRKWADREIENTRKL